MKIVQRFVLLYQAKSVDLKVKTQYNVLYVQVGSVYWKNFSLFKKIFFFTVPLYKHLEEQCVEFLQFSFRWMNNLLMREIPLRCTIRLWDTYQVRHLGFFQVCHCKRTWHYEIFTFANVVPNITKRIAKMFNSVLTFLWHHKDCPLHSSFVGCIIVSIKTRLCKYLKQVVFLKCKYK